MIEVFVCLFVYDRSVCLFVHSVIYCTSRSCHYEPYIVRVYLFVCSLSDLLYSMQCHTDIHHVNVIILSLNTYHSRYYFHRLALSYENIHCPIILK